MKFVFKFALIAIFWVIVDAGRYPPDFYPPTGTPPRHVISCTNVINNAREENGLDKVENNRTLGGRFYEMYKDKCPRRTETVMIGDSKDGTKIEYEFGKLVGDIPQSLLRKDLEYFSCTELDCKLEHDVSYYFVPTGAVAVGKAKTPKEGSYGSEDTRTQVGAQPGVVGAQTGAQSMDSPTSSSTVSSSFLLFLIAFLAAVRNF